MKERMEEAQGAQKGAEEGPARDARHRAGRQRERAAAMGEGLSTGSRGAGSSAGGQSEEAVRASAHTLLFKN